MDHSEESEVIAEPDETIQHTSLISFGLQFLQHNGWYILFFSTILYYLWSTKLSRMWEEWVRPRLDRVQIGDMKKNSDLLIQQESARLAAIERLQEKYQQEAEAYVIKQKEKEQKKKEEWIAKNSPDVGGNTLNKQQSKEEYNPLSGGGATRYRPTRRSGCPGNSCGGR